MKHKAAPVMLTMYHREIFTHAKLLRNENLGCEVPVVDANQVRNLSPEHIARLKGAIELTGFYPFVHAPFIEIYPAARDHVLRDYSRSLIFQAAEFAQELNSKSMIVHTGFFYFLNEKQIDSWADRFVEFLEYFLRLIPQIEILIENDTEPNTKPFEAILNRCKDSRVGLCLDIGHLYAHQRMEISEWLIPFAKRIRHVHLHDNNLLTDQHLFVGEGKIPYDDVFSQLAKHRTNCTFSLETGCFDPDRTIKCVEYVREKLGKVRPQWLRLQ